MYKNMTLSLICTGIAAGCILSTSKTEIVNGSSLEKENPGHWNTVGITSSDSGTPADTLPFCTASIVAPGWILTAAHCTKSKPNFVYFHNTMRSEGALYRPVKRIVVHPDYIGSDTFDLALAEYIPVATDPNSIPPGFSSMPIMKESDRSLLENSGTMMLVGYGRESQNQRGVYGNKLATNVRIHKIWLDTFLGLGLITYQDEQRRGACNGDSGGPAYTKSGNSEWTIAGVTHGIRGRYFGFTRLPTCDEGMGIYTYTAPFAEWISGTTKGVATPPWKWSESEEGFANALQLCTSKARTRSMHHAIVRLANTLEDLTEIPMSSCENFAKSVEQVRRFETMDVDSIFPALPLVGQMSSMEWLTLAGPNSSEPPHIPAGLFSNLSKLSSLTLRRIALSNSADLKKLPVRVLELNNVENMQLDTLADSPSLVTLRLTVKGSPRLDLLGKLPKLVTLEVSDAHLASADLAELARSSNFPRLDMASFGSTVSVDYAALLNLVDQYAQVPASKRFVFPKAKTAPDKTLEAEFLSRFKQLGGKVSISFY